MKKVSATGRIEVLGVVFVNVQDLIFHALKGIPKNGVYVGKDSKRYPCFDSEDYATENRHFWNFIFATDKEELDAKLSELKSRPQRSNYNKLSQDLHPMAYWGGENRDPVILTED